MVGRLDELRAELILRYALLLIAVVACSDGQPSLDASPAPAAPTAGVVDSILPPEVALERFLAGEERTDSLSGGAPDIVALTNELFSALESKDSEKLAKLVVTKAEYGSLYYPTSVYSRKPYELDPAIAWMLNAENNAKAARRLIERLGGRGVEFDEVKCGRATSEGGNRFHLDCLVSYRTSAGARETRQLFGSVMERGNRAKFLSLAGDF